ncbi:hypothetical protein B0H11DRAFT_2260320 [Mycena galericulata]|nr:hypothetical protein B0H11DRAFT_2260320 [Mycena galericulata]
MALEEVSESKYQLSVENQAIVGPDLDFFRDLLEEIAESPLYDAQINCPALFDINRVTAEYDTEQDVQNMVMDARRALLDIWAHLSWWTASVVGWLRGLPGTVIEKIRALDFDRDEKRGYLFYVIRDWREINFPLLVEKKIPFFYVFGMFEGRDKRMIRLDPGVIQIYLQEDRTRRIKDLWVDNLPELWAADSRANRYDRFFQLKIDPYSRPRNPVPRSSETSGEIEMWIINFQHWGRRRLGPDERWETFEKLYHHIVVEDKSERVTRVIFHRFHAKPRMPVMDRDDVIMDEVILEQDLSEVRERFKGRCAPREGQIFDPETGVEREKALTKEDPIEAVAKLRHRLMIVKPPAQLGSLLGFGSYEHMRPQEYDATSIGRSVGPRVSSPDSNHSSERREYDSGEPMAHQVGWAQAMAGEDWSNSVGDYVQKRNDRRYSVEIRQPRPPSPDYEDARSHIISSESSGSSAHSRSVSPEERTRTLFPIRLMSPAPFQSKETLSELMHRRARWLNGFADWGRSATFESCLWRVPFEFTWNTDLLKYGYLIINEAAEFRLRFAAMTTPSVRFPRHLLELALERGIGFAIGIKNVDKDLFRPRFAEGTQASKAMVDLRNKGPRLNPSPSMATVYRQYCGNVGKLGNLPHIQCLIGRGGAASWILRAYIGLEPVRRFMQGPSVQVTVHHGGANDSGDENCREVSWDDLSDGDYEALFGHIAGTAPEHDTYLYPTDEMMEEFSDHYYREWNPFCDKTFAHIKKELDDGRGKCRTKKEWQHYFQSSNRGTRAPKKVVDRAFIEEGWSRLERAFDEPRWNKGRICDLEVNAAFRPDF